jgi:predicted GIY-YIG superfamily endonuclease
MKNVRFYQRQTAIDAEHDVKSLLKDRKRAVLALDR